MTGAVAGRTELGAFAQLGKVKLFEIWLGPVLSWSLVTGAIGLDGRATGLCALFVVIMATTMCASHAFDDITGYLDGSDVVNYAPERRRSQVKPLVVGTVSVPAARAFAYGATGVAAVLVVLAWAVAGAPWWMLVGGLTIPLLGAQYSAGISFSYRVLGGGEFLTGILLAASVWMSYAAVTGTVSGGAWVLGTLFGLWLVQVLICSNTVDGPDDRAVGRSTVAARTSHRANLVFVVAVFAAGWVLGVVASVTGVLSPWSLLGLAPGWILHGVVLVNGLRGRWRLRRNYGFLALRVSVVGMVIVNVLT